MFPTYKATEQETVGARRERKARESHRRDSVASIDTLPPVRIGDHVTVLQDKKSKHKSVSRGLFKRDTHSKKCITLDSPRENVYCEDLGASSRAAKSPKSAWTFPSTMTDVPPTPELPAPTSATPGPIAQVPTTTTDPDSPPLATPSVTPTVTLITPLHSPQIPSLHSNASSSLPASTVPASSISSILASTVKSPLTQVPDIPTTTSAPPPYTPQPSPADERTISHLSLAQTVLSDGRLPAVRSITPPSHLVELPGSLVHPVDLQMGLRSPSSEPPVNTGYVKLPRRSRISSLSYPVDRTEEHTSDMSDTDQSTITSWSGSTFLSSNSGSDPAKAPLKTVPEIRASSQQMKGPPLTKSSAAGGVSPFARALAKMENAGLRIVAARLSEEWESIDHNDESYGEIMFEKRLWALIAYQWLMNGKQLQSPTHETLIGSRVSDCRRIMHLHGSRADGWVFAAKYPKTTVYSISSQNTPSSPTAYPPLMNHHCLYVPSVAAPLPFPDNYFDLIVSRSLATSLHNDEWVETFHECKRVLKPGGWIEILSLDPRLSRSGPLQVAWTDASVVSRLRAEGLSMLPSDSALDAMEVVGFQGIRRARIALPAYLPRQERLSMAGRLPAGDKSPTAPDATRLMALLGRYLYQDVYGGVAVPDGKGNGAEGDWFWDQKGVQAECELLQSKMLLTIACAEKPLE